MKRDEDASVSPASPQFEPGLPPWGSEAWHAMVSPQNYAFYEGIETLYKYRAFTTAEDERRVAEIIGNNTIFFSRSDQLNDPFDMAVRHEVTGDRSDPATRARVLADVERLMRARQPPIPEDQLQAFLQQAQQTELAEFERTTTELSRKQLAEKFPVFCLSADIERPAQWAYYAAESSGLCIHFDARLQSDSPFAYARRVEYQEARPVLPIPLDIGTVEVGRRIALIKHTDWDHEREYRVLGHSEIDLNLEYDGRRGRFSPPLITGITVGHRMTTQKIGRLRALAEKHDPPIPLSRAEPRSDTFSYSIAPI